MLCELLISEGKLSPANLERALHLQADQAHNERIGSILVKLGLVSERDVARSIGHKLGIRFVEGNALVRCEHTESEVSENFLIENRALILGEDPQAITLVMADPLDDFVADSVELCSGKAVVRCVGVPSEIDNVHQSADTNGSRQTNPSAQASVRYRDDVEQLRELAGEAPIIRLVNDIINHAAASGASDIHIEPFEGHLKVRYRVDGMLREYDAPPNESAAAVVSRVKIMASMNIAERRLAQDGRFKYQARGVDYDFRVSTVPTMHGESVVMRLLQRDQEAPEFEDLGFTPEQSRVFKGLLAAPHGIVLVTGPTGSGKSTTLYAALDYLNDPERMIITVEDPVEYNIRGINQMPVKPQIGLTFANALRSIVRQDPDVIMIGEMRDTETAEIAVQSALTGHLVLSTLHTNDAPSSVMRLLDMGVPDYLLTSALNAVQAQRLVRKLCESCKEPFVASQPLVQRSGLRRLTDATEISLYRSVGCDSCGHTGYAGRSAILEILHVTDAIRSIIVGSKDLTEIRRCAQADGMQSMRDDGLRKALDGQTTIDEVLRVTPERAE